VNVWIFALFFVSGISALIYEIAWLRILSFTFGSTAEATSCILAVFLGGLAIGSWFGGRIADKLENGHLVFYGKLELIIAIIAPLISLLVYNAPIFFVPICHLFSEEHALLPVIRIALNSLLLLLPTIIMGATSPVLTKYLSLHYKADQSFAKLYAANTLGAVIGSLIACFIGFAYLGLLGTVFSAALINLLIAISAFVLAKKYANLKHINASTNQFTVDDGTNTSNKLDTKNELIFLCLLASAVGFAALSLEVIWTRLLKFYGTSNTYSFTIMISCFLLGLAGGSMIYRYLSYKSKTYESKLVDLAFIQYTAAIITAASGLLIPISAYFLWGTKLAETQGGELLALFINGLIFIFIPALIIGITFPMIGGIATCFKNIGTAIGSVYSTNTLGCVIGALFVGLFMQPSLGSFKAFQWTIVLITLIGGLAFLRGYWHNKIIAILGSAIPIIGSLCFVYFVHDPIKEFVTKCQNPKVLLYDEDTTGIVRIFQHPEFKELRTNSYSVSSTRLEAKRYMRMLAILPALIHKNPKNVLVICFGTGTTAGAIANCPGVEHVDIVEISPLIIKGAHLFSDSNQNVVLDPKVSIHINDGRNFLLCTKKQYDVVTFEPPPLTEAGVVNLYSKEFYQIAKSHLAPNGILCQWIPLFYTSNRLWKMTVQSLREIFPNLNIWIPNNGEAIIMASDEPLEINALAIQNKIDASATLKNILLEVGLNNVYSIFSTFVIAGNKLDQYIGSASPVTDNNPKLEFYLPYIGKPTYIWDLQAAAPDFYNHFNDTFKLVNINKQNLDKEYDALSKFRYRSRLMYEKSSDNKIKEQLDNTIKLAPDNKFFQYAKTHPQAQG
jgi:predicted membrane-bound spermidine synthase